MEYFERDIKLSLDSDLDEIKRLARILKPHKVNFKIVTQPWDKIRKYLEMASIGKSYRSHFKADCIDIDLESHKFYIRLETGKNIYSIGILKGYQFNFEDNHFYTRISMFITFETPNGNKVLKRFAESCTFMPPDSELRFITPTPEEVRRMKEKLCSVKTNKFGRDMSVGTLIVAWNSSSKQMYYGKITKMYMTYFEYAIPDGSTKRCYNTDMVYVPENQEEFEFELTMEILKA